MNSTQMSRVTLPKGAFIPFIMAGDPSLEDSERLALALIEEGATAIELGVPFSDALADGPVIQLAGERALKHNVSLDQVIELGARIVARHPNFPIIVFTYLNPLLQMGLEEYTRRARAAGLYATLTVDLPPEEADEYCEAHRKNGLRTVFLASPTTTIERLKLVDRNSTAFIYAVSRTGVTGARADLSQTLGQEIARVRSVSDQPIAVGFGISTGAQAREVAKLADGVVVGSAFVRLIEQYNNINEIESAFRSLAREIVAGIRE